MLIEDQRFLHEDLERLEQAISDRTLEDPKSVSAVAFRAGQEERELTSTRCEIDSTVTMR